MPYSWLVVVVVVGSLLPREQPLSLCTAYVFALFITGWPFVLLNWGALLLTNNLGNYLGENLTVKEALPLSRGSVGVLSRFK